MVHRRDVLKSFVAAGLGVTLAPGLIRQPLASAQDMPAGVEFDPVPFTLGVASGYPTPDGVTLWTRLAPDPLTGDGGIQAPTQVSWVVADTPGGVTGGAGVVASGTVTAEAQWGHSVHVDVTGLSPSTTYYYGFASEGSVSCIGRTRTAPAGQADMVRFAVASCQRFGSGWYAAYRHIADEELDFVLHLGDYVYADSGGFGRVRTNGDPNAQTLAQYRIKHALYKGDPDLRRAHAMHPWIVTWDDHEVFNDYMPQNVAPPRLANAYRAYYEHLPIRLTEAGPPSGSSFRIHQQVTFGDLLDVAVMDVRQYRAFSDEPLAGGGGHWPEHPDNTMLGAEQKAWLKDMLASSTTAWRTLANSSPFAHALQVGGLPHEVNQVVNDLGVNHVDKAHFNLDLWDSYMQERYELLAFIHEQTAGDVVSVSGDQHRNIFQHVRLDLDNPASPIVLPEFAGTCISSFSTTSGEEGRLAVYAHAPHFRYFDEQILGYLVCEVTPERWRTTAWNLQHSQNPDGLAADDPDAIKVQDVVFEVLRGDPRMHHVSGENTNPIPDN